MNFDHIPELSGPLGYPFGLALIVSVCAELYLIWSSAARVTVGSVRGSLSNRRCRTSNVDCLGIRRRMKKREARYTYPLREINLYGVRHKC
jgi:hypothetical protein